MAYLIVVNQMFSRSFFKNFQMHMLKGHSMVFPSIAVENVESGRLHISTIVYSMISSEDCYNVYAMKSAMKQVAIGKRIMYREGEIETEFS